MRNGGLTLGPVLCRCNKQLSNCICTFEEVNDGANRERIQAASVIATVADGRVGDA